MSTSIGNTMVDPRASTMRPITYPTGRRSIMEGRVGPRLTGCQATVSTCGTEGLRGRSGGNRLSHHIWNDVFARKPKKRQFGVSHGMQAHKTLEMHPAQHVAIHSMGMFKQVKNKLLAPRVGYEFDVDAVSHRHPFPCRVWVSPMKSG